MNFSNVPLASKSYFPLALSLSLLLHGLLLFLHFQFPDASRELQNKALDIILVNAKSSTAPTDPQALAQSNLDGGGNTDADRRAKTMLPTTRDKATGEELEEREQQVKEQERMQQKLMKQLKNQMAVEESQEKARDKTVSNTVMDGRDLAETAKIIARMEAEISQNIDEYNKRPRRQFIGARTKEYRFAAYIEDWRQKVERIGTLNYPAEARGKLYGSLVLSIAIRADGSVERVSIDRSSGHRLLDDAARRIVQLAAPYAAFSSDLRKDTDIIEITRAWSFVSGDQLTTTNQ